MSNMAKTGRIASHDRETISIYWHAILQHRGLAVASLLNPVAAVFNSVLVPFFASRVLVHLASHQPGAETYLLYMAICAAAGIACNRIAFTRLMELQARTMADLHERVFQRLLERSTGFHANRVSGKLVSDAIDFVNSFSTMVTSAYTNGAPLLMIILSGLVVVFLNSVALGVYILAVVIFTAAWAYRDSRMRFDARTKRIAAQKRLTAHLADSIVNAPTVKTFARESYERQTNNRLNQIVRDLRIHDWQMSGRSGNSRVGTLLFLQILLLFIISRLETTDPAVLATGFFAFTYVFTITTKLFDINNITRQVEESLLDASPMTEMLLEPIEVVDAPHAAEIRVAEGAIKFEAVHFHYQDTTSDQTVFAGLDMDIRPGERIGLVGPSGGGKSTFTRLLLRFEDLDSGAISIDGQNIANVTQDSLRRQVAYVPQEPLLFHRTIKENIAYGRPSASEREIKDAARKAHAVEFITDLPHGFDTVVGERGVKLSGGQRQRVAIARAILKNAPILMLDEATSALDSESEVMIQKALWELMQGRTAIVIAHRLSTIQRMDRIIVLDEGQIIEQGAHLELLRHPGMYSKLWSHQSGGFLETSPLHQKPAR
jgi:ATP-binding cassette subfamily B protein